MLPTAKPLAVMLLVAYASGAPLFDPIRPAALDMPLKSFHEDVRLLASDGVRTAKAAATDPTTYSTYLIFGKVFDDLNRDLGKAVEIR